MSHLGKSMLPLLAYVSHGHGAKGLSKSPDRQAMLTTTWFMPTPNKETEELFLMFQNVFCTAIVTKDRFDDTRLQPDRDLKKYLGSGLCMDDPAIKNFNPAIYPKYYQAGRHRNGSFLIGRMINRKIEIASRYGLTAVGNGHDGRHSFILAIQHIFTAPKLKRGALDWALDHGCMETGINGMATDDRLRKIMTSYEAFLSPDDESVIDHRDVHSKWDNIKFNPHQFD